jgi:hypothetical protein
LFGLQGAASFGRILEGTLYIEFKIVKIEGKELRSCNISKQGERAWLEMKKWLRKMLECGGDEK